MKLNYKKTALAKRLEEELKNLNFEPERKTEYSVGYDLRACIDEKVSILPDTVVKIGSGVHLDILHIEKNGNLLLKFDDVDIGIAGWLTPRSSIDGLRLDNTNGIIDTDYQGELIFKVRNSSQEIKTISPGERFMQLIFIPVLLLEMNEVEEFVNSTKRGEGGFGSTGG